MSQMPRKGKSPTKAIGPSTLTKSDLDQATDQGSQDGYVDLNDVFLRTKAGDICNHPDGLLQLNPYVVEEL